jgi:error-prone DNA polymerase
MGFYSPASLVQDARRHGVKTLPVCVLASDEKCRVDGAGIIRLGLSSVHGLRAAQIHRLLAARNEKPFDSLADFFRRTTWSAAERRALAGVGALNALAGHRRAALWSAAAVSEEDDLFRGVRAEAAASVSPLAPMNPLERIQADYRHQSLTTGAHPMKLLRDRLPDICPAAALAQAKPGSRVKIAGAVITRQRPGTAKGFCFITLEDETGLANAIVRPKLFEEARLTINLEPSLLIVGRLQNEQGVIHVMAEQIGPLPAIGLPVQASYDFH